jgi:hypothetical protein
MSEVSQDVMTPTQTIAALTPLQLFEKVAHQNFYDRQPSEHEVADFLHKRFPQMDGGLSIAIALAALILQGWQVYRYEQDRLGSIVIPPGNCPWCGRPAQTKNVLGQSVCAKGHTW